MSSIRKKSGYPLPEHFSNPLHQQLYTKLVTHLTSQYPQYNHEITEDILCWISYNLQYLMEEYYGKKSKSTDHKFVKLPHSVFTDFTLHGSLYHIFVILFQKKSPKEWKNMNIKVDSSLRPMILELFLEIESVLIEKKLLKWPVLYFTPTISENLKQELTQIALDHRGSVVNHVSEASHIIDWDEEVDGTLPQQLEEEFCRPVEIRPHEGDGTALVHWWYHPDSYDEWIPSQEVEGNVLPDDPVELRPRVWKLSCRYIRDVLIFNEWGNELDYEIEEGDDDSPLENHTGRKRKGRKSDESRLKKRVDTLIVEAVTATDKMLQNLPPPTSNPNSAVTIVNINGPVQYEYEVKSENLNVPSESKKRSAEASHPDSPSQTLKKRLFMESHVISDTDTKCDYPVWFDRNMISSVERRYLPEVLHCDYFGSNSIDIDPHCCQKYLTIRNYIMDLYNQNPFVYLSATECRQKISGDVSIIIRIHEFLDVFGLINFSSKIKPHSRPPKSGSFYSSFPSQSEIISHCESISSYGKNSQIQSLQCNGHTNHWTPEMDQELLSSIVSQQAADVDIDWNTIAATLNQYNPSITAKECFMHFVQMSLLESSLPSSSQNMTQVESCTTGLLPSTSCELNTASSHLYTEGSGRNSWGVSRKIRSVAALVVSECSSKLDYNQAQEAISAVNEVYRKSNASLSPENKLTVSTLVGGAGIISTAAHQALESKVNIVGNLLDDYISTRLLALEEKIKLVSSIEKSLDVERERIEMDRRDLQIQRAQLSFLPPR